MKNSYFLKKKISATVKSLVLSLVKTLISFYKFTFAKRTILFVTNNKIRTFTLGPITQICALLFLVWVGNIFAQTMRYDKVIESKAEEISKLRSANKYFEDEFEEVNEKLKKINEYLASIIGNAQAVKGEESQFKQPKNFKEEDLSRRDKHTLNQIKDVENQLSNIQSITQTRIKRIENAMAVTGLNIKKIPPKALQKKSGEVKEISLNGKKGIIDRQGGPLDLDSHSMDSMIVSNASEESLEEHLENIKFSSELDYLMMLEKIANVMPFAKPMKNYYISSGFGTRADPITRRMASHQGLDFVGVANEKIISPSKGKVILAGQFSGYGNAIVIDHGFGVTTRYGHLSAVKVVEGQMVKQGDVIALQGSTGRSTGAHLHYEVRYKNIPLNPRRFLEAGESLFNDDKSPKYANS
jgi:murein DD-endopeptidase MepM/ murein hydrolase activator NlpD